jgi:hypothetical protein
MKNGYARLGDQVEAAELRNAYYSWAKDRVIRIEADNVIGKDLTTIIGVKKREKTPPRRHYYELPDEATLRNKIMEVEGITMSSAGLDKIAPK